MKDSLKKVILIKLLFLIIIVGIVCKGRKQEPLFLVDKTKNTVINTNIKNEDYLEKDVVLAAFIWEDNFSDATFFPAKILKMPEDPVGGKYNVEALAGSRYVDIGKKHWTQNVILKSHPAKKDEIKIGQIVFYCGEDTPYNESILKNKKWNRGVVLNTSELYQYLIEVGTYNNIKENVLKKYRVHLKNVRISDDPIIQGVEGIQ